MTNNCNQCNEIKPETLFTSYAALIFLGPVVYPFLCLLNEIDGSAGYYYGIPQGFLPEDERPHHPSVAWPGINNNYTDYNILLGLFIQKDKPLFNMLQYFIPLYRINDNKIISILETQDTTLKSRQKALKKDAKKMSITFK